MIYTGRWTGKYENAIKVSICVGDPKWATVEWKIKELAPYGIHGKYKGDVAKMMYREALKKIGVKGIAALLKKAEEQFPGKNIILCCWENVHKGEACHRRWLAEWLKENGGMDLQEAADSTMNSSEPMNRDFTEKKPSMEQRQLNIFELMAGGLA